MTGTFIYRVDRKGRIVVPAAFRRALGEPVTLTAGPDASLLLIPRNTRRTFAPELTFQQPLDPTTGRVLIPWTLREWAGIAAYDEVAVCGQGRQAVILPWERCCAALRRRVPGRGLVDPAFLALLAENAALRRRLETGEEVRL